MHTKEMIMKALQEMHDEYDCTILNYNYRGPMEKIPMFTTKEIAARIGRTSPTVNKWCKILYNEKLIEWSTKRRYFANDPIAYTWCRKDVKPRKLKNRGGK